MRLFIMLSFLVAACAENPADSTPSAEVVPTPPADKEVTTTTTETPPAGLEAPVDPPAAAGEKETGPQGRISPVTSILPAAR